MIFGGWIIYKQVYALNPNGYLALIGFGFMMPAAVPAILSILSIAGSSSQSQPPRQESSSRSSSQED
jgi:hypothetical protein